MKKRVKGFFFLKVDDFFLRSITLFKGFALGSCPGDVAAWFG